MPRFGGPASFGDVVLVDGVPVGEVLRDEARPVLPQPPPAEGGSIIVVVATDAPLLPHACRRLAQRASLGIARSGGGGENSSGDIVVAFATGNRGLRPEEADGVPVTAEVRMLNDHHVDDLFWAAIEATEEAIVNSLFRATPVRSRSGAVEALPIDRTLEILRRHGALDWDRRLPPARGGEAQR
jgi:D-aminopeptidase